MKEEDHMGGAHMSREKAKDFKGTFKKLLSYLGRYKIAILLVMIFRCPERRIQHSWPAGHG